MMSGTGSLPVRERGLKHAGHSGRGEDPGSLPVRERGLKLNQRRQQHLEFWVAPRAGAWIETRQP